MTPRTTTKDTELGGVFIPKGTNVIISLYELHRNPKFWNEPDTFDPERFAPGTQLQHHVDKEKRELYAPFSSGSRVCIGKNLTLAQQRLFLPMLCK